MGVVVSLVDIYLKELKAIALLVPLEETGLTLNQWAKKISSVIHKRLFKSSALVVQEGRYSDNQLKMMLKEIRMIRNSVVVNAFLLTLCKE